MSDFTTIMNANCKNSRTKKMIEGEELTFLELVRDIWHSAKSDSKTLVVVKHMHCTEVLFRNYAAVMQKYFDKGLLEVKTYDTLCVEDFDKEIFEL